MGAAGPALVSWAVFSIALALGHHHLGDLYTLEGTVCGCNDLQTRALRGRTVDVTKEWFRQHDAVLRPLVGPQPPDGSRPPRLGCQAQYG